LNRWKRNGGEIVLKLAAVVLFMLLGWRKKKMRWKKKYGLAPLVIEIEERAPDTKLKQGHEVISGAPYTLARSSGTPRPRNW